MIPTFSRTAAHSSNDTLRRFQERRSAMLDIHPAAVREIAKVKLDLADYGGGGGECEGLLGEGEGGFVHAVHERGCNEVGGYTGLDGSIRAAIMGWGGRGMLAEGGWGVEEAGRAPGDCSDAATVEERSVRLPVIGAGDGG
jgi:hypothetical protein